MSIIYIYYSDDPGRCGHTDTICTSNRSMISLLDRLVTMFGGQHVAINNGQYPLYSPISYPSLLDAHLAYPDHSWMYLYTNGDIFLDQYEHPKDNVVYVVGHEVTGIENIPLKGPKVRIRTFNTGESQSIACLIVVICDRGSRTCR